MSEAEQNVHDGNEGESESVPEQLREHEIDLNGRADNRRWRYAVRDLESIGFAGPGIWRQIGPAPLQIGGQQVFQGTGPNSGEVVDIAFDPRGGTERIMYVAAGNGGLWRSTDAGTNWKPVTDQLPATSIGAVALDPVDPDIIYVGTGNLFVGAGGMAKAAGIFKSVDGGRSWSRLNSPAGRPPQQIAAAVNVAGGVRVTVAGHGYASLDRVVAVGLPGVVGAAGEGVVRRIDANTLRIGGVNLAGVYGGGAILFDARQPPFLSDRGIIRMVCPAGGTLLVAAESGLYYSKDHGRNFGANFPDYNDGRPIRTGLISALEVDQGWNRVLRVADATPATPIRVTLPGHGFVTGDHVVLGGVTTNRAANGGWTTDVVDPDHITLRGSSGNGTGAVTGFAIGPAHPNSHPVTGATNPAAPNPIVITAAGHGYVTGDIVAISGTTGNTAANGSWVIRVLTPDTFSLTGSRGNGAYAGGGVVDGPRHRVGRPITAAVNNPGGVRVTVVGHGLIEGDRVSVTGLPGIAAPGNSAAVHVIDANTVRLNNLALNAVYGGVGAVLAGPADSWNTVYFASAGRLLGTTTANPDWGLYRLAITSAGEVVISRNLMANPGIPAGPFGRVAFCQSLLPRSRDLYISVQNNEAVQGGVFVGLFHSDDFGGTWNPRPAVVPRVNADGAAQSSYNMVIGVDPQDARRIYTAQQQLWRSTDGGATWPVTQPVTAGGVDALGGSGRAASFTLLHWDHHELVFPPATWWAWTAGNPVAPTPAYHGTDGGVARSDTTPAGALAFTQLNEGLATSLLTSLDIGRGAGNNEVSFAGMQDAGTAGHRAGRSTGGWTAGHNGDGGPVAVDPFDPNIAFGISNGNLIRTTNRGLTWFTANLAARVEIEAVDNTNPVRVTTAGHPFRTGDTVTIAGVPGGGGLANGPCAITVPAGDTRTFTLNGKNGVPAPAFGPFPVATGTRFLADKTITVATLQAPIQIETSTPHGCANGDRVRIEAVQGNLAANNTVANPSWRVTVISSTRLSLDTSDGTLSQRYVRGTGRLLGPGVNGPVPVFGTTNANPIVVTARGHGFLTGEQVSIAGVTGNTAANVAGQVITVLDRNSFSLNGVAGNAAPGAMPRASLFQSIGRNGVTVNSYQGRIALVPQPGAPSSLIFLGMRNQLFRSTNGGISFVPMSTFTNDITAVHAPDPHRLWVATSNIFGTNRQYRVHFSRNQGASYDGAAQHFVGDIGARSFITQIIEDPARGGQRVAVVCAGYSRTDTARRTRHVFLSESGGSNAGGVVPWREVGGVFGAAPGNLPDIPVLGAAWDTSMNPQPSQLLIATDAGVLRLDPGGPSWSRVGPNLPKVGLTAIAGDAVGAASVIRVGSYGRSAWQLEVPPGPSLFVEADLGFGDQQIGTTVRRRMTLHSVGSGTVQVTGISGATGDITVESVPPGATFPINLVSGARQEFDVVFTPSAAGDRGAFLMVSSDDPQLLATEVKVTGFGIAAGAPRLSARAFLEFGVVRTGQPSDIAVELRNVGDGPLPITALDRAGSDRFSLVAPPALPLTIPPSGSVSVTVRFDPNANGVVRGALMVRGGGQGQVVTLTGEGTTTAAGMVALLIEQLGIGQPQDALA
ncbi:choice-of-anchor D domain-containing protein [Streptomyces sp. NPDC050625]|uniref:choice-of-anchor D domain-containing protein n=1 Tax=Streptomyces sp. NPDC050625 TaxID=3154629 RepID=UPI00343DE65E